MIAGRADVKIEKVKATIVSLGAAYSSAWERKVSNSGFVNFYFRYLFEVFVEGKDLEIVFDG